jgi:hypothetical protein
LRGIVISFAILADTVFHSLTPSFPPVLVVSHGHQLSVWSLSSLAAARQLEDWSLPCDADPTGSKVLSLAQMSKNANEKVVSLHSNGIVAVWDAFGPTPLKNKENSFMDCNMPAFGVIR